MAEQRSPLGSFTISLDFELYWGVRDKIDLDSYRKTLLGARDAIPRILDLFAAHGVRATWATVGFLFFDDRDELLANLPRRQPQYVDPRLSPYRSLSQLGPNERRDPYHFGRSLLGQIMDCPGQEVGTHTFSHYYCLEPGQTTDDFRDDLEAARTAAGALGIDLKSLVFPRNQYCSSYLDACHGAGIQVIRGPQPGWMYRARAGTDEGPLVRALRLADAYVNLSGRVGHRSSRVGTRPLDASASRFFRPHSPRLASLEPLRLNRILQGMTAAALHRCNYHLWWHPHNFGSYQKENLDGLGKILGHFSQLRDRYGLTARTMGGLAAEALAGGAVSDTNVGEPPA